METLEKLKQLMEKISVDTKKVFEKGNYSATIRSRRHAQDMKKLVPLFRKEILEEAKRIETIKNEEKLKKRNGDS